MSSPHNPIPDPPGADVRPARPGERPSAVVFGAAGGVARDRLDLPLSERRRRRRELWLAAFVVAAIAFGVVLERRVEYTQALPFGPGVPFFFLNALNVILIVLVKEAGGRTVRGVFRLVGRAAGDTLTLSARTIAASPHLPPETNP